MIKVNKGEYKMIKINMDMPRTCSECPFYSGYKWGLCLASNNHIWDRFDFNETYVTEYRHEDCPLQEVYDDV